MNIALLTIAGIFLVGMLIPQFLVRSIIGPTFRVFVIPGVILHELAHAFFCLLTGAKIRRIRLFKRDGGEVAHEQSKIPLIGPLLITMAPLLIGLLAIVFMAKRIAPEIGGINAGITLHNFPQFLWEVVHFIEWSHPATWIWLYFILAVGATLAPSWQDLKNSLLPLILILIALGFVLKTGMFRAPLEHTLIVALPALTVALFILLVIASFAFVIYALSSVFGITR